MKEAVRPVLTQKELKRRRIATNLVKTAKALEVLRVKCAAAQHAVSTALKKAKTVLVLEEDRGEGRVAS